MNRTSRRLTIQGQFDADVFYDFARYFANRLNLRGVFRTPVSGQIEIDLEGAPELIDMFEMAHWMGPRHADVISVDCTELPPIEVQMNSFVRV